MTRMAVGVWLLASAASAEAYVGPGMGLGVLGAIFGLLAAIFLAVAGLVWYPVKRMLRAKRGGAATAAGPAAATSAQPRQRGGERQSGA
jgi:hypothetical protein